MLRNLLLLGTLAALTVGCTTLEERLAKRVGCDPKQVAVQHKLIVPAYSQYEFTCDDKKWTCRDAPFVETCNEGWHRDQKNGKAEADGKKKKKKKKK